MLTVNPKETYSIPKNVEVIETKIASIWLDERGWLISISKDEDHNLQNMKSHFEVTKLLLGNRKTCFLTHPNLAKSVDAETRRYLNEVMPTQMIANAHVTNNTLMRIGLNIFFQVSKNKVPSKIFSTDEEAIEWLIKMEASL